MRMSFFLRVLSGSPRVSVLKSCLCWCIPLPIRIGEVALAVPWGLSRPDAHPEGGRWNTICQAGGVVLSNRLHVAR